MKNWNKAAYILATILAFNLIIGSLGRDSASAIPLILNTLQVSFVGLYVIKSILDDYGKEKS